MVRQNHGIERRLSGVDPLAVDSLLAACFTVAAVVTVASQEVVDGLRAPDAVAYLTAVLTSAPIAVRRRWPLAAVLFSSGATLVHVASDAPEGSTPFSLLVLVYSVAAWASLGQAVVGFAGVLVTLVALSAVGSPGLDAFGVAAYTVGFAVAWSAGVAARTRRENVEARTIAAEERAAAERERATRAVLDERLVIARELHDIVAHSMSVIAVQAGVGLHLLDDRPEGARDALQAISTTSRSTLADLRRLLGVLRDEHGDRSDRPAPGLDDVEPLVAEMQAIGMPVTVTTCGSTERVPAAVQASAYRVIQESLTNVVKHAGPASAVAVRIEPDEHELLVTVTDDGRGLAHDDLDPSDGHGILGMRERVEVWGGRLATGPAPGGGFQVRAVIPLGANG